MTDEPTAGLLAEPRDAEEIATALQRFTQESDLVHRLSRAGREQITTRFNIAMGGRKLEEYQRRLRRHRSPHSNNPDRI